MSYYCNFITVSDNSIILFPILKDYKNLIYYTDDVMLPLKHFPLELKSDLVNLKCDIEPNTFIHLIKDTQTNIILLKIPKQTIQIVIKQTNCTLNEAIITLYKNNGNFLNSIRCLKNNF